MKNFGNNLLSLALTILLITGLASCSGNSSSSPLSAEGTVATGAPVSGGTVTIKDKDGHSVTATTDSKGKYSAEVAGFSTPFLIKVDQLGGGSIYGIGFKAGTVNVHPLTHLLLHLYYKLKGEDIATVFANLSTSSNLPTEIELETLESYIKNQISVWLVAQGVDPSDFSLMTSGFSADGTGFDKVLDQIQINFGGANPVMTITDGTTIQSTTITPNAGAGSLGTTTTAGPPGNSNTTTSNTTTLIPISADLQSGTTGVKTLLATFKTTVNSKGSNLSDSDLTSMTSASLLHNGRNQADWTAETADHLRGVTMDWIRLKGISSWDNTNKILTGDVTYSLSRVISNTDPTKTETIRKVFSWSNMAFKEENGVYVFYGNQRAVDIELWCETRQTVALSGSTSQKLLHIQIRASQNSLTKVEVNGGGVFSTLTAVPKATQVDVHSVLATPNGTATEIKEDVFLLNQSLTSFPANGATFTITITPSVGAPYSYVITTDSQTSETPNLSGVSGYSLGSAQVGQALNLSWNLPTTLGTREVSLYGKTITAGYQYRVNPSPAVYKNTSGSLTMVDTVKGESATVLEIHLLITGTNGEKNRVIHRFTNLPAITSLSPNTGPIGGGTTVILKGLNLNTITSVTVGASGVANLVMNNAGEISFDTPAISAGAQDVVVNTLGGTATLTGGFTYYIAPTITANLSTSAGPVAGGTSVTITGTDFIAGSTTVTIGGASLANLVVVNSTTITGTTPVGTAGARDVVVTTPANPPAIRAGGFTYYNVPVVTNISPAGGKIAGGEPVTITGTGFGTDNTRVTVTIGGKSVTPGGAIDTSLPIVTPAHTEGSKTVVVTTPGGSTSVVGAFVYYDPPTITSITPSQGTANGGTLVSVIGTNFVSGSTSVTVGGSLVANLNVLSANQINFNTPAGTVGAKDVIVTTPGGSFTKPGGFTYVNTPPTITSVSPNTGSYSGGMAVTITGKDFVPGATTVTIGGNLLLGTSVSTTTITGTTPPGNLGGAPVVVSTNYGSALLSNGFVYIDSAPPLFSGAKSAVGTSSSSIELSWNSASDGKTAQNNLVYNIYYSTTSGNQNFGSPNATTDGGATSFNVALLSAATTYYFVVRARDQSANEDTNLVEVSATTLSAGTATWTSTASLTTARNYHTSTLLPDGKVLMTGGYDGTTYLSSCELYDPATGTWIATGSLNTARARHTATLLPNGQVLVVGGSNGPTLNTCELYNPATGAWTNTGSLNTARQLHTATLLQNGKVLVASGLSGGTSCEVYDPVTGTWTATGSLTGARNYHTATLLQNGRVLVVGGANGPPFLNTCELYDPSMGTWSSVAPLTTKRYRHTAILLASGKILVVGGSNSGGALISCEIYDPSTASWSVAGSLNTARDQHTATLLPNGKVLIAGGWGGATALNSAELYDPSTGNWTNTALLNTARYQHTATLLPSGTVLAVGGYDTGYLTSSEIYDSPAGNWRPTGSFATARNAHSATLLPSGKVLIVGGFSSGYLTSCELYDPATGNWSPTGSLATARNVHTATLLPSGKVLIAGGSNGSFLSSCEIYDPATGTWSATGSLTTARTYHTATLLPSGKVLVTGGYNGGFLTSCELYDPATGTWSTTGSLTVPRIYHTATLLPSGKVLVTGGYNGATPFNTCEVYDPPSGAWSFAGSLTTARNQHTATLLPSGKVLITGGWNAIYLTSCEVYNPSTNTWGSTGSLNSARDRHTAILLASGKVLVTGGFNGASSLSSCEVYDPPTGNWSATGSLSSTRDRHTATLLASGKVLVLGGPLVNSCELYNLALGVGSNWEPVIGSISGTSTVGSSYSPITLSFGSSVAIMGIRFRGISSGSGGGTGDSPTNFPIVRLMGLGSGSFGTLDFTLASFFFQKATNWTDTQFGLELPNSVNNAPGYYIMTVIVNGIPSKGVIVKLQ